MKSYIRKLIAQMSDQVRTDTYYQTNVMKSYIRKLIAQMSDQVRTDTLKDLNQTRFPPLEVAKIINVSSPLLYQGATFLHQKYTVEKLSTTQISALTFSSKATILKYMKRYGIPSRKTGSCFRKPGQGLPYGVKIVAAEEVPHKKELKHLSKMQSLRDKGFSYRKIALICNTENIPTKTRRTKWQAKSVHQVINRANKA
jgi:hypothetical protein